MVLALNNKNVSLRLIRIVSIYHVVKLSPTTYDSPTLSSQWSATIICQCNKRMYVGDC